jgi:hypothetical protein
VDMCYGKPGAPQGRGMLSAFCVDADSWASMLPRAWSKKPFLSSALWPLALWHMHMASLHRLTNLSQLVN